MDAEIRRVWDANATFWDERMGVGTAFHHYLNRPTLERLLGPRGGQRVLKIARGNAQFARQLSTLRVGVLAVDASLKLLQQARARPTPGPGWVEFRAADATDEAALVGLSPFDAVVASVALMDMVAIEPLARATRKLLRPASAFVFSDCYPAFNTSSIRRAITEEYPDGTIV